MSPVMVKKFYSRKPIDTVLRSEKNTKAPSDYPLPNLYYFTSGTLEQIRKQLTKQILILNKFGFEECHLPFLVPKSLLSNYQEAISPGEFIKAYSGKDRRSYAFLRPDGIFSQGITLAKRMIKSYQDLPLKLFEVSPGYAKSDENDKETIFNSQEQSFSIQGALFTESNDGISYLEKIFARLLREFSIKYTAQKLESQNLTYIEYTTKFKTKSVKVIKCFDFGQEITKKANLYFFDKSGRSQFPYMVTFSLSQNISLIKTLS